jgi:hypothetical protein
VVAVLPREEGLQVFNRVPAVGVSNVQEDWFELLAGDNVVLAESRSFLTDTF